MSLDKEEYEMGEAKWYEKWHTMVSSAQGMFFTTIKVLLYAFAVTATVTIFSHSLFALNDACKDIFGIHSSIELPAVDKYYNEG